MLLVGSLCTINCFLIDQQANLWGAVTHPHLFLIGGFFGTVIGAILYSYLVFTETGSQVIEKFFLN